MELKGVSPARTYDLPSSQPTLPSLPGGELRPDYFEYQWESTRPRPRRRQHRSPRPDGGPHHQPSPSRELPRPFQPIDYQRREQYNFPERKFSPGYVSQASFTSQQSQPLSTALDQFGASNEASLGGFSSGTPSPRATKDLPPNSPSGIAKPKLGFDISPYAPKHGLLQGERPAPPVKFGPADNTLRKSDWPTLGF